MKFTLARTMSPAELAAFRAPVPGYGAGKRIERIEAVTPWNPIISRAEARSEGLLRYFTGKPCLRGHICERRTSDKTCLGCDQERWQARVAHPGYSLRKMMTDTLGYNRRALAALEASIDERDAQRQARWEAMKREPGVREIRGRYFRALVRDAPAAIRA